MHEPGRAVLSPGDAAIVALAEILSDAPWRVGAGELERLRGAGVSDDSNIHAVCQSAFFNYLNRVADGVGIEFDYDSPIPPPPKDAEREPEFRPAPEEWPEGGRFGLRLADRPGTASALARWRVYELERDAPLMQRERRVLARAAAGALCDGATWRALADAEPASEREHALATYSERLTEVPWRVGAADLDVLRAVGFDDDRVLLDIICVIAYQNAVSRVAHVLEL